MHHVPACLLILTGVASVLHAEDPVLQARKLIEAGDFVGGLAAAKSAIRQHPSGYKGYYYASLALLRIGQLAEAGAMAQKAQACAPPEASAGIQKLVSAIASEGHAKGALTEGDEALAKGQTANAAEAYQRAWQATYQEPEAGVKAAALFMRRLGKLETGAQICQELLQKYPETPHAENAVRLLSEAKPKLQPLALEQFRQLPEKVSDCSLLPRLEHVLDMDSALVPAWKRMAEHAATCELHRASHLNRALVALNKNQALTMSYLGSTSAYQPLLETPSFQAILRDVFSPSDLRTFNARIPVIRQRQAALKTAQEGLIRVQKDLSSYQTTDLWPWFIQWCQKLPLTTHATIDDKSYKYGLLGRSIKHLIVKPLFKQSVRDEGAFLVVQPGGASWDEKWPKDIKYADPIQLDKRLILEKVDYSSDPECESFGRLRLSFRPLWATET
ncbi:MAG: hypothetical protein LWX11_05515, partial [Firmicutes bacterium]|nr:hypothetical protein [Bacillota bacterium]